MTRSIAILLVFPLALASACGGPEMDLQHGLVVLPGGTFLFILPRDGRVVAWSEAGGTRELPDLGTSKTLAVDSQGIVYLDERAFEVIGGKAKAVKRLPAEIEPTLRQNPERWQGWMSAGRDGSRATGRFKALCVDGRGRMYLGGSGISRLSSKQDAVRISDESVYGLALGPKGGLHAIRQRGDGAELLRFDSAGRVEVLVRLR